MDFVTAFLNGDLDEDIYMEVPADLVDPDRPNLVCKLHGHLWPEASTKAVVREDQSVLGRLTQVHAKSL